MPNATERADARALPETTNRRAVLGAILAGGAVAATALPAIVANAAEGADSEILVLEAKIWRLSDTAEEIKATRVDPFEDAWCGLYLSDLKAASRLRTGQEREFWQHAPSEMFGRESGREKAVDECEDIHSQAGALLERMLALAALTQAGRAAKVRTLLRYVAGDDWRGPGNDLDWEIGVARKLLGEFAGMSEKELANV
jgi:hypothetical protein